MLRSHSLGESRSAWLLCVALLGASALLAASDWPKSDPSGWTDKDVYKILNDSPWSKTSKIKASNQGTGGYGDQTPGGGAPNGTSGQVPPSMGRGGMGRRGMGGGSYGGSRGSGGTRPSSSPSSQPAEVTVQWQSALPVRLAAAKKSGGSVDIASYKPLDEYVIAVIGLPMSYIGGHSASSDSAETNSGEDEQQLQNHLKSVTSLLRSGHDPVFASKVELNQGVDGRILFYFPKTKPVTAKDGSVEFRIALKSLDLRKKFTLKDMEYRENLQL